MDIHAKEFGKSFRGFDETEVNDFLNEIIKDYAAALDENERLRAELTREQAASAEFRRIEHSMRETLIVAQRTAEDVTATAKQSADQMLETAAKEAQNLRQEASLRAKAQLDDAADKVRAVVAEYERLVREKHAFLRRMKNSVQEELALIEDAIAEMPDMAPQKKRPQQGEGSAVQEQEGTRDG